MHPVARAASVVGAVGAAGLAYASLVERNAYALRRVTVPVLPAGHRPLRVVHVSDLHLMPGQRRKAAWVAALADLRPDLVVNTGDNISHPDAIPLALEAFSAFEGVPGVFVMGSNDYFVPQPKNPFLYLLPPRAAGAVAVAPAADRGPRQGDARPRLDRPDQRARDARGRRVAGRVRRGRRPAPQVRPLRPGRGAVLTGGGATRGRHPRALPAHPRRHDPRRRRARHRRPHPRRPALPAPCTARW